MKPGHVIRVSWPHSQLKQYGAESPTTENKTNSSRGSETNEGEKDFNLQPGTAVGENEFNSMRDSSSSPLLLPLTGINNAHQLSGTAGSDPGSQVFCQAQVQDFDSTENRQYHVSGVHKQSGRHSLQRLSNKKVIFRLCEHQLAYSGNASNLFYHLEKEHPGEFATLRNETSVAQVLL